MTVPEGSDEPARRQRWPLVGWILQLTHFHLPDNQPCRGRIEENVQISQAGRVPMRWTSSDGGLAAGRG